MSRNFQAILFALLFVPLVEIQAQEQQIDTLVIDLQTAIDIAVSENPTVKVADQEITKKEFAKKGAYAPLLPQINLIGQYQRTLKRQTMYLDGAMGMGSIDPTQLTPQEMEIAGVLGKLMGGSSTDDGIQVGRTNMWTTGLNVSLPLVVPSLWKNIQLSQVDIELAMEQARSSRLSLVNQVKKAYYSLLLAQDSYNVFKETYANDSISLKNIKDKYDQGLVAEYDVITADVRLKSIIPNILQSENMMKIAALQLKMLMGIDGDIPLKINDSLNKYESTMFADVLSLDTSLAWNTDLKQFDLQTDMAKKAYEIRKLQFSPTLTSSFNYVYISQNNNFKFKDYNWDPYSTVGITLNIPLFTGGDRYYNVKQAKIQLDQLQLQRVHVERNLKIAVKNNVDLINKSVEQITATQSVVEQAKKGYLITQKRYETGMGTIVDMNAAALAVTSSELQYRNAIYDYLSAKADLEKVIGEESK